VTPKMLSKIQEFTSNPDYKPEILMKANLSCRTIAAWVIAVERTAVLNLSLPQ
jgi:hypothetical protein